MHTQPHLLGKLNVEVAAPDLDMAMQLRPQIEALANQRMPQLIARVFDTITSAEPAGVAENILMIDRLELDLGVLPAQGLEDNTLAALELALAEALATALHEARFGIGTAARLIPAGAAQLEGFEAFLTTGTAAPHLKPADVLCRLAENEPEGLIAMMHRLRGNPRALERLVLQGGQEGLHRLLGLLAPAEAATILALLVDLRLAHRTPTLDARIAVAQPALERLMWVTTLEFLLQDAGSQFNRRRFLDFLLQREARQLGIDYVALLGLFNAAMDRMRAHLGIASSLPVVLDALLAEHRVRARESRPVNDQDAAVQAGEAGDYSALLARAREGLGRQGALDALVGGLPASLFTGLIRAADPARAGLIVALLDELSVLGREAGPPSSAFSSVALRSLALRHALSGETAPFSAERFLADLLSSAPGRAHMAYARLAERWAAADIETPAFSEPSASSARADQALEAALEAARQGRLPPLIAMLRQRAAAGRAGLASTVPHLPEALFEGILRERLGPHADGLIAQIDRIAALHRAAPLALMDATAFAAMLREILLMLAIRDEALPSAASGDASVGAHSQAVIAALAQALGVSEAGLKRALIRAVAELEGAPDKPPAPSPHTHDTSAIARALTREIDDPVAMMRCATTLDQPRRDAVIARLAGDAAPIIMDDLRAFARLHAASPLASLDTLGFELFLWVETVRFLVAARGGRFDQRRFAAYLLRATARHGSIAPSRLAARLQQEAASRAAPARLHQAIGDLAQDHASALPDTEQMRALIHFLRTGQPRTAGRGLVLLLEQQPAQIATLMRNLAQDMPGGLHPMLGHALEWLLPGELIECLMPGRAAPALRWAQAVGINDAQGWSALAHAMLRDEAQDFTLPPRGFGHRLDQLALAAHWLAHGTLAWWAPRGTTVAGMAQDIAGLSRAELDWLLAKGEPGETARRLGQVLDALTPSSGESLLHRLVPWGADQGGPLGSRLAGLDAAGRRGLMLRAAAAVLDGRGFDLADLAAPPGPVQPPPPRAPAPIGTAMEDRAALFAWLDGASTSPARARGLARLFARLADEQDEELAEHIHAQRGHHAARARWQAILPPEALGRLVSLLAPAEAGDYLNMVMLLAGAWRRTLPFGAAPSGSRDIWALVLDLLAEPPRPLPMVLRQLIDTLAGGVPQRAAALRAETEKLARQGGHVVVATALRRAAMPPSARALPAHDNRPSASPAGRAPSPPAPPPDEPEQGLYIANAGLALIGPFLPTLFQRLQLLGADDTGKPAILGLEGQSHAVHLLQYLVDGRLDQPEPLLAFNKLLCGLPTATPIMAAIDVRRETLDICDSLLRAVIENWTIIGSTSIMGLRETFLQREGRLAHGEGAWELQVQRKGLDVLVDRIPWSISTLFHRWMAKPIRVIW